jgi:hypothetical protein
LMVVDHLPSFGKYKPRCLCSDTSLIGVLLKKSRVVWLMNVPAYN